MKHLWMYLIHGEDIGKRLFLALVAGGTWVTVNGTPATTQEWAGLAVVALTGAVSKSEKEARKIGK